MSGSIKILSGLLTCLALLTASCVEAEPGPDTWIKSCEMSPGQCVATCQKDPLFCAQQINGYLLETVGGGPRFKTLPIYPGTVSAKANVRTPMHGDYLTIFLNDIATTYVETLQGRGKSIDYVDFPNGSLIIKANSIQPDMSFEGNSPWLTVMFKIDGYCHAQPSGTGNCTGGEWFYYLYRFGNFHQFDGVPVVGKAEPFCIDCHGPVQKADFLFQTFGDLLKFQKPTLTVASEKAASRNVAAFCEGTPIGPILPGDVAKNPGSVPMDRRQLMFDCLSWRSFLALNWPNLPEPQHPKENSWRGVPDPSKSIVDSGPRVWETYRAVFETFQPNDPKWTLKDQNWNATEHYAPVCKQASVNDKVLRLTGKQRYTSILDETHQAFGNQFNILVDQNNRQALFEVRINRDEFEYLKANGFATTGNYDVGGPKGNLSWQATPLQFPDNIRGLTKTGAIELKASWRVLCTDARTCNKLDDPNRYYSRDAVFFVKPATGGEAICEPVKVGLVGYHIGHKTFWSPQWVWSTFEHVDNVPPAGSFPVSSSGKTPYSFYGPRARKYQPSIEACRTQRPGIMSTAPTDPSQPYDAACPNLQSIANSHPANLTDKLTKSTRMASGQLSPNQVTRIDPMTASPLNVSYPEKLRQMGSVFQHYRLINTQWPMNGRGTPSATTINMNACKGAEINPDCYTLIPLNLRLRNTTLETFQVSHLLPEKDANGQASSGGCMQCHGPTGVDFSFVWVDAAEEIVPLRRN
jgi:hypothetical protein